MKRIFIGILTSYILLTSLNACKKDIPGALSLREQTELAKITFNTDYTPEQKYLKVSETISALLLEALEKRTDAEMMEHIRQFKGANSGTLQRLAYILDEFHKDVTDEERVLFVMRLISQSYTKDLKESVYEIRRRISDNPEYKREFEELIGVLEIRR